MSSFYVQVVKALVRLHVSEGFTTNRPLLTVPRRYFFCGSFVLFMYCVFMFLRLFISALWSPVGKGLTSWLVFVLL